MILVTHHLLRMMRIRIIDLLIFMLEVLKKCDMCLFSYAFCMYVLCVHNFYN